jgi:SAM-dependent methyltransferase
MLTIPNKALKYILFQRTEFSFYSMRPKLLRLVMNKKVPVYNLAIQAEALLMPGRTKKLFSIDMEREYELIKNFLPANLKNILDIGCGVGGIDIMFHKHYIAKNIKPHFHLLDKSEVNSRVYYGLEKEAAYYNSLSVARDLLIANGVEPSHVYTQEVGRDPIFPGKKFDLVVSLISWGFHYPITTYLDYVYNALSSGGSLIIDVRKGTDGEEKLQQKFGNLTVMSEAAKHRRILVKKQ